MSGPDYYIIVIAAAILLSLTAIRFLITELTTIVVLLKRLRAAMKNELPKE
jgi:hypothetical protein